VRAAEGGEVLALEYHVERLLESERPALIDLVGGARSSRDK